MAVNAHMDFRHLRSTGFEHRTDQKIAEGWDRAFEAAAGTSGTTTRRTVLSGWNRAFAKASGKEQGGQS